MSAGRDQVEPGGVASLAGDWIHQNGANLRRKQGEHWYSVVLRPRSELLFGPLCHNIGIAFFVPLRPRIRITKGQKKRAITPIFPGYGFCRADESMASRIRSFEMVNRLDAVSDEAKLLDYLVDIDEVWLRANKSRYRLGASVAVTEGPFEGIEGRITEVLLDRRRVIVEISTIGRPAALEIESDLREVTGRPAALEIESDLLEVTESPDDNETFQELSSTIREISDELIKLLCKTPRVVVRSRTKAIRNPHRGTPGGHGLRSSAHTAQWRPGPRYSGCVRSADGQGPNRR